MTMQDSGDELPVVVVAAQPLTRDVFSRALDDLVRVVAQAANLDAALDLVSQHHPRAALVFSNAASPADVVEDVRAVKNADAHCGVVVLADVFDARAAEMLASLPYGGWGYLPCTAVEDVPALGRALRAAADGLVLLDRHAASGGPVRLLTRRQQEVLELMARGLSNPAIARHLVLEEKSVENHINAIFNQLGVNHDPSSHPRVRAVLTYLRLVGPGPATGAGGATPDSRPVNGRRVLTSRA